MIRIIMSLCISAFISVSIYGQDTFSIKGRVVDSNGQPLTGSTIVLFPILKGCNSDTNGEYRLSGIEKGDYFIEVSYMGYITLRDTVYIDKDLNFNTQLNMSTMNLDEVIVNDNQSLRRQREEPLPITQITDNELKRSLGGSLMGSLRSIPGVTTIDIGTGQSKPVIRGLGFNRVVVVENGIKHEGQQWGVEHVLEIDQYAMKEVEIIKGPSSILYGSDAIGGVIDIKSNRQPPKNTVGGSIDISGESNSGLVGTSLSLFGRKNSFYADLRATIVEYGDYRVPTDSVDIYSYRAALKDNRMRNTAGEENDIRLLLGAVFPGFSSSLLISNVLTVSGFFANAHGLEPRNVDTVLHDKSNRDIQYPYQSVDHLKIINTNIKKWDMFELETIFGFQSNFRQEWSNYVAHGYMPPLPPDSLGFDPDLELQFDKQIYSGKATISYKGGDTEIKLGLSGDVQKNSIGGRAFIIPSFSQSGYGLFGYGKFKISGSDLLQLGIRYDLGFIGVEEYSDWFLSPDASETGRSGFLIRAEPISRYFHSLSWSLGYNHNVDNWSFKTNLGKSFRMPDAKELAANGVNYHRFSYEVGNPGLLPESSYQIDAGIEYSSNNLSFGASPFINYFSNYIYLNPTSDFDRMYGNGNQIYCYTQSDVFRYGGEIHADYQPFKHIGLKVTGEYVYSEQLTGEKKGYTLPFSPPASATTTLYLKKERFRQFENPYFNIDYQTTAPQFNIVPPEEVTYGYQVISLGMGGDIRVRKQTVNLTLQIKNLLNAEYFNHTSYYRLINVPEPSRNIVFNLSLPFSTKIDD